MICTKFKKIFKNKNFDRYQMQRPEASIIEVSS
jgi:hypothetical protein